MRSTASGAVAVVRDRAPFIWLVAGVAIVLWLGRAVLAPFILAAVLAYAFSPLVGRASVRTGWPRVVVVAVAYVFVVALLVLAAVLLAGRIANELTLLAASGPDSFATLLRDLVGQDSIEIGGQHIAVADVAREIQSRLGDLLTSPGDAVHVAGEVGTVLLETILALIVTFYFLVDGPSLWRTTTRRCRSGSATGPWPCSIGSTGPRKWLRGQLVLIASWRP
jgi:predicted PurR-regulated permease PerM